MCKKREGAEKAARKTENMQKNRGGGRGCSEGAQQVLMSGNGTGQLSFLPSAHPPPFPLNQVGHFVSSRVQSPDAFLIATTLTPPPHNSTIIVIIIISHLRILPTHSGLQDMCVCTISKQRNLNLQ